MSNASTPGSAYVRAETNPALARMFDRIPAHVRQSFSPDQIEALRRASLQGPERHMLAVRRTIPIFGRRYYLAMFIGRDRRRPLTKVELFLARGMRESWFRRMAIAVVLLALAGLVALGAICITYLVKSLLRIDLLPGPSILHNLLYWR